MGNTKRLTSLFVALVLVFGCVSTGFYVDADALEVQYARSQTQDRTANFSREFTLTGNYADDVVTVAKAQLGKTEQELKYTEAWCANFANDVARLTGMPDDIVPYNYGLRASCYYMYTYMINNCNAHVVEDVNDVRSGDYVFYYCPSSNFYLHVGLVESPEHYIEGNFNDQVMLLPFNYNYSCYQHHGVGYNSNTGHVKRIYVRPNYSEPPKNGYTYTDPEQYSEYVPTRTLIYKEPVATSGYDVCWTQAVLYKLGYLNAVTGEYNKNTVTAVKKFQYAKHLEATGETDEKTVEALQKAYDKLLSPECTSFKSSKSTYYLDETIELSAVVSNADSYRINVRDADKNFLKKFDNTPNCSFSASELGEGAYTAYIRADNSYTHIYSKVVSFTVEKPVPSAARLSVNAGSVYEETELLWDNTDNTVAYDLYIIDSSSNSTYKVKKNLTVNEYSIYLPKGKYSAYVVSRNDYSEAVSNSININVVNGTPVDMGSSFYTQLRLSGNNKLSMSGSSDYALMEKFDGSYEQTWYFEKNRNSKSYTIKNCSSGKVLTVGNNNILTFDEAKDTMAQRWYIGKGKNGYYLIPSKQTDKVAFYSVNSISLRAPKNSNDEALVFNKISTVHNYEITELVSPSCTENGYAHYHCIICGEDFEKTLAAEGHRYVEEKLEGNRSVFTCVYCGDSYETGTPHDTVETSDTPDTPDNAVPGDLGGDNNPAVQDNIRTHTLVMGDVDGDGEVTVTDALIINRASVGIDKLTDVGKFVADVDCDGRVTAADSLYVLREVVRLHTDTKVGDVFVIESELDVILLLKDDDENKK